MSLSGSAGAATSNSSENECRTERIDLGEQLRVTARPNKRWEIVEPDGTELDGTYLDSDPLFQVKPTRAANRSKITIDVKVKQRDLQVNQIMQTQSAVNFFNKLPNNHRRLLDIFIAKSLSSTLYDGSQYLGEITLSNYQFESDGQEENEN